MLNRQNNVGGHHPTLVLLEEQDVYRTSYALLFRDPHKKGCSRSPANGFAHVECEHL